MSFWRIFWTFFLPIAVIWRGYSATQLPFLVCLCRPTTLCYSSWDLWSEENLTIISSFPSWSWAQEVRSYPAITRRAKSFATFSARVPLMCLPRQAEDSFYTAAAWCSLNTHSNSRSISSYSLEGYECKPYDESSSFDQTQRSYLAHSYSVKFNAIATYVDGILKHDSSTKDTSNSNYTKPTSNLNFMPICVFAFLSWLGKSAVFIIAELSLPDLSGWSWVRVSFWSASTWHWASIRKFHWQMSMIRNVHNTEPWVGAFVVSSTGGCDAEMRRSPCIRTMLV